MTAPVLAAHTWRTNAELVADCARLGYLRREWRTIDPTYGRGVWWRTWRPDELVAHDLKLDGVDFRDLPHADASFDAAAYDPPYVCVGGRRTTGMPEFHDRFGLDNAPTTPAALQHLINAGLSEIRRVLRPRATLLVKCQDYVSSGALWIGTHHTLSHALELGFKCVDRMERIQPNPRPQPANRHTGEPATQRHARRNLSTLFVLRAPNATRRGLA